MWFYCWAIVLGIKMKGWNQHALDEIALKKHEQTRGVNSKIPIRDLMFYPLDLIQNPNPQTKSQPEYTLQKQLCQFIRTQHPNVLFLSDTVASVKLSFPQQGRNKAIQNSSFHCPDLMILEPRGKFSGLFLELKVKSPFKADGTLYKNEHLQNQFDTLTRLNERGYKAMFIWSLEMGIKSINNYFGK